MSAATDHEDDGWALWLRARLRAAGELSDLAAQAGKLLDRAGRLVTRESADLAGIDGEIGTQAAEDAAGKLARAAALLRDVERIAALWELAAGAETQEVPDGRE